MNYLNLSIGIITKPSKTFEQIIKETNVLAGLLIWTVFSCLYLFTMIFLMQKISYVDDKTLNFNLTDLFIYKKTIVKLFGVYLHVFFLNIVAVKYYKLRSGYIELLSCNFFILIVGILNLCLVIVLTFFSAISFINYPMILFIPWFMILDVLAIKKVYRISTGIALKIFLFSLFVMTLLSFAVSN